MRRELCDHMIKDNIIMHILMVYHKVRRLNLQRLPFDFFFKFACAFSPNFLIKIFAIFLTKQHTLRIGAQRKDTKFLHFKPY